MLSYREKSERKKEKETQKLEVKPEAESEKMGKSTFALETGIRRSGWGRERIKSGAKVTIVCISTTKAFLAWIHLHSAAR